MEKIEIPKLFENVKKGDIPKEIMESVVNQIENKKKGIYLYSKENGTGKTHIAYAIAKYLNEKGWRVKCYKVSGLLNDLRDFDEGSELLDEIMKMKGLLILDDIGGSEKISEWVLDRLYNIIDYRYEWVLPILFTSNCNYDELSAKVGGRIASRVVGSTELFELGGPDKRLKEIKQTI